MEDAECPKCREEDEPPDHIVFRGRKIKMVKDVEGRDRRKWVTEEGMRWDSWGALASKKWVRTENTGRADEEGDLMEEFFENLHHQIQEAAIHAHTRPGASVEMFRGFMSVRCGGSRSGARM